MTAKKSVRESVLVHWINCKLARRGLILKKANKLNNEMGDYFIIKKRGQWLHAADQNPEQLGRYLGVLEDHQRVEWEE